MLVPIIESDELGGKLAIMQAWAGVFSVYKGRPNTLSNVLQSPTESLTYWTTDKIGNFDGGLAVVKSGPNVYVFIGPASGLSTYAAWTVLGINAIANGGANAWVNELWSGFLGDISTLVMSQVRAALGDGGFVEVVGFSQGGAMATYVARLLRVNNIAANVYVVGFGTPRCLGEGFPPDPQIASFYYQNMLDPVNFLPPAVDLQAVGGTIPPLPIPARWAENSSLFRITYNGDLSAITPPPTFGIEFGSHSADLYSVSALAVFAYADETGFNTTNFEDWVVLLNALVKGDLIILFSPQPLKPIPPNNQAPQVPPIVPPPAQGGPALITPFWGAVGGTGSQRLPPGLAVDPH